MRKLVSIEINNSTFFESPVVLTFSDKLNCIMGGRGTGKSTLLHFIKACIDLEAEDNQTTYNILKNNLGNGIVTLIVEDDNGKLFKIQKSFEDVPQAYKLPGENLFVEVANIISEINCDIYEAQSIEEIGRSSLDRLKLIDKMLLVEKNEIESDIKALQVELKNNCRLIQSENANLLLSLNALKTFEDAEEELKKLIQEKPEDIQKEEEKQFEVADKNEKVRVSEKRYITTTTKKIIEITDSATELEELVENLESISSNTSSFFNKEEISKIHEELKTVTSNFKQLLKDGKSSIEKAKTKITKLSNELTEKHALQQNEFTRLKQKFEKHKIFYNKWNSLTKKIDEKAHLEKEADGLSKKRDKYKIQRKKLMEQLNLKKKELFNKRKEKVSQLNQQFNGSIKITLAFNGITDEYEQILRSSLKGSNMRYNAIIPNIVDNLTPDRFASIVHEKDYESLANIAGIDKERSEAIFTALCETENIYNIECLYCADLPEFHLKVDGKDQQLQKGKENYKKSEELSTGQRCTTVLPIVFAVSNNPLIIDQPEDNLDNKYISETIHEIIREQKETRQLIFITHNPNIPVLSDSDLNFFLNYSEKKSKIEDSGTVEAVKSNILSLLEGGKEAFEKREKLYGGIQENG